MTPIGFLLFLVIGCLVGFMAGLFGVGGGFILVPILYFTYEYVGLPPSVLTHVAIGTSLFVVIFASLTSAYQHGKQKNVDWRAVGFLGVCSVITAMAAARLAAGMSGRHLRMAFALIVMAAALRMLTEKASQAQKKLENTSQPSGVGLIGVGLTAGVVSGLAGIGGGVFTIPMMYYVLKMPLKRAIGTSSATIVLTGLSSLIGYIVNGIGRPGLPPWHFGFVDLQRGIALAVGTILLARVGAYVSYRTHPFHLRKLFSVFVLLTAIYMLFK